MRIDPNARHPRYPHAATLADIEQGETGIITLDMTRGGIRTRVIHGGWRQEKQAIFSVDNEVLAAYPAIVSEDENGNLIHLSELGLHPYIGRSAFWEMRRLSVVSRRESVIQFRYWLEQQGFARAVNEIEDRFFEFFMDWKKFMQNIRSQA